MQQPVSVPIPPYGSPEYITGASSSANVNRNGYSQQNNPFVTPTTPVGGGPLPQPMDRGLQPPNLSMHAQPGPPRSQSTHSDASTPPYLREDPQPPQPPPPLITGPSNRRPHSSPFPRFVPPPMPVMPRPLGVPTMPGSMYPPALDYHSQALAIVGAHPAVAPQREQPAFYPAMMRPQGTIPGRAGMPVEAVMARYGQALPDEPPRGAPIFPRSESTPMPSKRISRKLSRPNYDRRTMSDQQPPPAQPAQPAPPLPPPQNKPWPPSPVIEEKKRPGSMLRKLTKKRPRSTPANGKGKLEPRMNNPDLGPPEILPGVLFHVRATQDYEMQSYDEISYSKGSIIAVKTAPESGRWTGYVVDSLGPNKSEGIFYRTFVSLLQRVDGSNAQGNVLFLVEAVYSYRAAREDEFDFSAGDTISVYSTPQGPFWIGVNERSASSPRTKLFPWKIVAPK